MTRHREEPPGVCVGRRRGDLRLARSNGQIATLRSHDGCDLACLQGTLTVPNRQLMKIDHRTIVEFIQNNLGRRMWDWLQKQLEQQDRYPLVRVADRYLIGEFLKAIIVVVSLCYVMGVVIVLFDEIDTFLEFGANVLIAAQMVLLSAPYRLAEAAPLVMLLASVFSMGRLVHAREMDAMIVGGYRLARLIWPMFYCSAVCAAAFFLTCEYVITPASARAENLLDLHIKQKGKGTVGRDSVWMLGQHGKKYFVQSFQPSESRLLGVDIIEMARDGNRPAKRIKAATAEWDASSGIWRMRDGMEWIFSDSGERRMELFAERSYLIEETPHDFLLVSQDEAGLSHADLKHLVRMVRRAGGDPIVYLPHLRLREALPFSLIIMSLLGMGIAFCTGRGGYVVGLGISLLVGLVYYGVLLFCLGLAGKGLLAAGLAAWIPNLIFGAGTFGLLYHLDRGT
ncbi:MAG TPA: LptF/LptG family permease [bacterium]|nr:LptF/LptG family permease [bacterium]